MEIRVTNLKKYEFSRVSIIIYRSVQYYTKLSRIALKEVLGNLSLQINLYKL